MKKSLAAGALLLALTALAGCAAETATTGAPASATTVAPASATTVAPASATAPGVHTYAGGSTAPFLFSDPSTAWEDLTPEAQRGMIDQAHKQGRALIIWGAHVEWTDVNPQAPAEQKQWVERMVERYNTTDAPVVFVVGLGSDDLYVERQNLDAPAGEQAVEKVTYNSAP